MLKSDKSLAQMHKLPHSGANECHTFLSVSLHVEQEVLFWGVSVWGGGGGGVVMWP